jgi:hypothetical protein
MSVASNVGIGFIAVTPEMAQKCVDQGIGKIVERSPHPWEPRKSLFGYGVR